MPACTHRLPASIPSPKNPNAGREPQAETDADSHDGREDGTDEDLGQRPRAVKVQGAAGQVQVEAVRHRPKARAPERLRRVSEQPEPAGYIPPTCATSPCT